MVTPQSLLQYQLSLIRGEAILVEKAKQQIGGRSNARESFAAEFGLGILNFPLGSRGLLLGGVKLCTERSRRKIFRPEPRESDFADTLCGELAESCAGLRTIVQGMVTSSQTFRFRHFFHSPQESLNQKG